MVSLITLWIANLLRPHFGLKADTAARWVLTIGLVVVLFVLVAGAGLWVRSCYIRKQVKEASAAVEAANIEVIKKQAKVDALKQSADVTDAEVQKAEQEAKAAEEKRLDVIKRDSTTEPQDIREAFRRFCQLYPEDTKCI